MTYLHPDHQGPHELLGWNGALPARWNNGAARLLDRLGIVGRLQNSFVMVAGAAEPTVIERILGVVRDRLDLAENPRILGVEVRNSGSVLAKLALPDGSGAMMRIPTSGHGGVRLESAWSEIGRVRRETPWVGVPEPIARGVVHNLPYYVERRCEGESALSRMADADREPEVLDRVLAFLLAFNDATRQRCRLDAGLLDTTVGAWANCARRWRPDAADGLDRIEEAVRTRLAGRELDMVRVHGDFHADNVLCDPESGEVRSLIDWDCSARPGFPLHDVLHFLLKRERLRQGLLMGPSMVRLVEGALFDDVSQAMFDGYVRSFGLAEELILPVILAHWLRTVHYHFEFSGGRPPEPVVRQILYEPLARFGELLA